ncbi:hypothetical protein CGW93_02145 [candidate division bacterium WOR-3 4484_18]|uniref:DUF3098 domain-containing protein n=1 Tax=candidate division WOR-3 bacterium 4484_18 TaxID=2020626 RepID=A0A257LU87_UNCW3|nr:MAG: hypothetical protein CGW93_02145 [candidate division bacterium WOR-3 4484_18]
MGKKKKAKPKREEPKPSRKKYRPRRVEPVRLSGKNYGLLVLGLFVIFLGFIFLKNQLLVAATIALVVGYLGIIPLALLYPYPWRRHTEDRGERTK